ncbi:MAG: hypothetical protein FWG65_00330, partial [Turicibacter sp.]|nr:hypothetical protein [Turicibacter sp.]
KISSVFENMKNSSAKSDKLNSHLNFFNNFSEELILSQQQMNQWLADNGMETDTLSKKAVAELLKDASKPLGRVLSLRQQLAKSSVKKYQTMENAACADGRARGMFQFYGANRIDRWASRLIQMQKLPQNHLTDLEQARGLSMTEISPLWNCSTIISPMRGGLRHCHPRRSGLS